MAKQLVIVEYKDEVEFLLKNHSDLLGKETEVLSLLPEASVALKKRGIPYETSIPYFSKQAHEKCLSAVDKMIKRINEVISIRDHNGIEEAYNNTFTFLIRLYLSYILFVLELLDRLIQEDKIETVYAFDYDNNDYVQMNLSAQERIMGQIVQNLDGEVKVSLFKRKLNNRIGQKKVRLFFKSIIAMVFNWIELIQLPRMKGPSVLFYSLQYNFDTIARNLKGFRYFNLSPKRNEFLKLKERKEGFEVRHLHLNNLRRCDKKFTDSFNQAFWKISETHFREEIFTFNDVDFSNIILNKVRFGFNQIFNDIHKKASSLKSTLNKLKPSIIVSAMSRELSFALGELAKKEGIPSMLISHGSHVPPKNKFDRMEWLDHGKGLIDTHYQYHLLQSPWAQAYAQKMSDQKNYHNIFPVIFEKVDRSHKDTMQSKMYPQSKGKKIIVHASSPKSRRATRFYVYETMDEYIENMKDVIEATRTIPEVFLIIRFRPSSDLKTDDLISLLPEGKHYTVATEGKFTDYLQIADLLVSFSSTTIEEALINTIPVLQYDRTGRYMHLEGSRWKSNTFDRLDSVYWIGNQNQLKSAIDWIIKNQFQKPFETIFERHTFKPNEAQSAEDVIELMAKG